MESNVRAYSASVALLMASSSVVGWPLSSNWRQMGGDRPVMKRCSMADVIASEGYDSVNIFFNSDAKSLTFSPES